MAAPWSKKSRKAYWSRTSSAETTESSMRSSMSQSLQPTGVPETPKPSAVYFGNRQPIQMRLSDDELMRMATQADASIPWGSLHHDLLAPDTLWKRKRGRDNIAVYTKVDERARKYSVVAVSEMSCSLDEMHDIVSNNSPHSLTVIMSMLWSKQFIHGDVLHELVEPNKAQQPWNPRGSITSVHSSVSARGGQDSSSYATQLAIKHAVFKKPSMFAQNEEWYYVDLLKGLDHDPASSRTQTRRKRNVFTKTIMSIHPNDLFSNPSRTYQQADHNGAVLVGFSFEEEPSGRVTRLRMYAEGSLSNGSKYKLLQRIFRGKNYEMHHSIKNQLMGFAKTMTALPKILRRQQLGLESSTDSKVAESVLSMSTSQYSHHSTDSNDMNSSSSSHGFGWSAAELGSGYGDRQDPARPAFDRMLTDLPENSVQTDPGQASFMRVTKRMNSHENTKSRTLGSVPEDAESAMRMRDSEILDWQDFS